MIGHLYILSMGKPNKYQSIAGVRVLLLAFLLIGAAIILPVAQTNTTDNGEVPFAVDKEEPYAVGALPPNNWSSDVRLSYHNDPLFRNISDDPKIAVNGDTVHVIWQEYIKSDEYPEYLWAVFSRRAIFYTRSTDGGMTWDDGHGNIGNITQISTIEYESARAWIDVSGNRVHTLYLSYPNWRIHSDKLIYRGSSDNGLTWDNEIVLFQANESLHESIVFFHLKAYKDNVYVSVLVGHCGGGFIHTFFIKSSDGGFTWSNPKELPSNGNFRRTELVVYENVIYDLYATYSSAHELWRSYDYGETWDVMKIPVHDPNIWVGWQMAVEGEKIYIPFTYEIPNVEWWEGEQKYMPYYQVLFIRSLDNGVTWSDLQILVDHTDEPWNIYCSKSPERGGCGHAAGAAKFIAEGDNVYMIWADARFEKGNSEILFKYSNDKGTSWSDDIRLTNASYPSVLPYFTINKVERVFHVIWRDHRNSPDWLLGGEEIKDIYYKRYPDWSLVPKAPTDLNAEVSSNLNDILITWNLSIDDPNVGLGTNNVTNYNIYYSTTYDSNKNEYQLLDTIPAGINYYEHLNEGEDDNNYFYYVASMNSNGFMKVSEEQVAKYTRSLRTGSNVISVPLILNNYNIEDVLKTLKFESAWYYNSSNPSDPWKLFNPIKSYNDLLTVDNSMGIVVNIKEESQFTVAGKVPFETQINLKAGWNLLGYPSFIERTVSNALSTVAYERIEGYADLPPENLKLYNDNDSMQPGYGYWIKVSEEAVLTLNN